MLTVAIVEAQAELGALWARHLERLGARVHVITGGPDAMAQLALVDPRVIILDLDLPDGNALALADYASYRCPNARVICVTRSRFFSDGSIFNHAANAAAFLSTSTPPADLAAVVEHVAAA